jgi:hypothetical protein
MLDFFRKNPALLQPKFGACSSGRDGFRRFFPHKKFNMMLGCVISSQAQIEFH